MYHVTLELSTQFYSFASRPGKHGEDEIAQLTKSTCTQTIAQSMCEEDERMEVRRGEIRPLGQRLILPWPWLIRDVALKWLCQVETLGYLLAWLLTGFLRSNSKIFREPVFQIYLEFD